MRSVAAALYLGVMAGVIVLFNAGLSEALIIWSVASLGLGWVVRNPWLAILPALGALIAGPFGYADDWIGGDALYLWAEVIWVAPLQAAFVLAGVLGHLCWGRFHASRT